MDNTQSSATNAEVEQISLKDVFLAGIRQWKLLAGCLVGCLALAGLYVIRTPQKYSADAAVEIKDENNTSGMNSALSAFSDMGVGGLNANMYNEMAYFESPDLMEKVVKNLGLMVSYAMKKNLRPVSPYGSDVPVKVVFPENSDQTQGVFRMRVNDEGLVTLDKFVIKKEKLDFKAGPFKLGSRVKTPLGELTIEKGPDYEPGEDYKIFVVKYTLLGAAKKYTKKLKVSELSKDATVIELSITDESSARAKDVLVGLINAYNENWILDKNQVAISTSNFINERLAVIEEELGHVDSDISDFKSSNKVPDLAANVAMYMNENQALNKQILEIGTQLQIAKFLREHLMANAANNRTLPVNLGIQNPSIETLLAKYNDMVLQRNSLELNSSSSNPFVVDLDSKLSSMRTSLAASLDTQIKSLATDLSNLERQNGKIEGEISANPSQAKYLLSVERQQKVKEQLYLYLLQKREENELNQAFTAYNTRVIMRPTVDTESTSPNVPMIFVVAFLLGVMIPFGIVYIKETTNTKLRGREDLGHLTVPFLGELPMYRPNSKERSNHMMVVRPGERNVINEAFRIIRTNLSFLGSQTENNVIMVTSFNPGSGKTFITMNLAQSLAIRDSRVLVIDGDIRRGSTSEYVGNPQKGLAQYLSGKVANIADVILPTDYSKNLFVLPAGKVPPNPTELLENGKFANLIEHLKGEYDYVFIDCPPVGIVADARIMETVSDRCIFVVRTGLLERSMIPEIEKLYQDHTFRNMAIILNGSLTNSSRYGYAHGYANSGQKNYYTVE